MREDPYLVKSCQSGIGLAAERRRCFDRFRAGFRNPSYDASMLVLEVELVKFKAASLKMLIAAEESPGSFPYRHG